MGIPTAVSPADTLPAVLTVPEVAQLLHVERKTIYDAIRRNQLPGVIRLGRAIRIHTATLLAHLSRDALPGGAPPTRLVPSSRADDLRPNEE
jgi:excisionase family DNA binding protein